MRLSTDTKVTSGFALALVIIVVIGIASITSIRRLVDTSAAVSRTHASITDLQSVLADLTAAESAQRGYILTGEPAYLPQLQEASDQVGGHMSRLREASFDVSQEERLGALAPLVTQRLRLIRQRIAVYDSEGPEAAIALVRGGLGKEVMDSIRSIAREVERAELDRLQERNRNATTRGITATVVIAAGGIFAFLVVLASALVVRRDLLELRRTGIALRESETLLSQFMENLPIGVMVVDAEWQPRFANNAAVDILGTSVLIDTGERPLEMFRADDHEPYADADRPITRALAGDRATVDDAEVLVDGEFVPLEVSAAPIYDSSGRIAYAIAAFSDITERRRAEEALRHAKDAAETASRTKSDFLARMSHELRTPLNSVIGFANILLKNKAQNLRDQDIAYLDRIQENGKHLLLLINDILDLSKIEAGRVEIESEIVNLRDLLSSVAGQWEGQLKEGVVALQLSLPDEVDPVITDSARLRQVMINLVGNAVKFTERGTINVALEVVPDTHRPASIRVSDTGIGIPPDRLGAIFDAFEQAESTTSRKYGGTGLGLPISRALCELLGYRLSVHSTPGVGTDFIIDLMPDDEASDSAAPAAPPHAGVGARPRDRLVLIIDDESDSRILLTHYVEEFGYRTIATHSAANAMTLARELKPDLITLDLMMPELNGWDLLSALKADPDLAHIPVVIVSIVAQESRGSLLGAVDLLQKPLDRDALFSVLQRSLGTRRARILVVDDAPDARRLLHDLLIDHAIEVRTATDGQDALTVLRDYEPDLVITDLLMPVMDGMTFLEIFRSTPRFQHVPVVVVTSKDLTLEERDRLNRHTAAVLRKGNTMEADLRRVLGSVLTGAFTGTAADERPTG